MKKLVVGITATILLIAGGTFIYKNVSGPKISKGIISKSIDNNGKPVDITNTFSINDNIVYFSAKPKNIFTKKAKIVWYKGEISNKNRIKVDENISLKDGYFTSDFSVSEGLTEGKYSISIYADDSDIIETTQEFEVK